MATDKVSAEDRLLRRRQAARVRQQRCRARKRQALVEGPEMEKQGAPLKHPVAVPSCERQFSCHQFHPRSDRSPRSVYTREVWAPRAELNQRPQPPFKRHSTVPFSYDPMAQNLQTRYDSEINARPVPVYSHYQPSRRPALRQFVSLQHRPPCYRYGEYLTSERDVNGYPYNVPEKDYRQAPQSWVHPMTSQSVSSYRSEEHDDPMMSKEEAAIDAILSLKSGQVPQAITPPRSPVKRVSSKEQGETSAFRRLPPPSRHPLRQAIYMTVRIA
ncbi:hypothetical protein MHU86_20813 [Fragilaria crotonensis]|nr:hypothetical protein MHU86_20813 [Fragilaria crotonensis]